MFDNKKFVKSVVKLASYANFYGKRLRDRKLEICENMRPELLGIFGLGVPEANALLNYLEDHKPVKAQSKKRASVDKPAANTIQQGAMDAPTLPPIEQGERIIIFGVQNNVSANQEAWSALLDFAGHSNADLIALPIWYNKKAFSSAVESEKEYFDPCFEDYLVEHDAQAFGGLVTLRPEAATSPTAKFPVNAAATLNTGELITVIPSTKQQLKTLPSAPSTSIKEAWTTGVMTQQDYTRSRAGAEARSDHVYGGVMIERVNGILYARNLVFKNGEIFDSSNAPTLEAVAVLGDLHCEVKDQKIWDLTVNWLEEVEPSLIVVHDILHFSTASHHNRNDGKHLYKVQDHKVVDDLKRVITDLNQIAEIAPVYVVESNHNSALDNWLHDIGYNPKRDPRQAKIYYLLNYLVAESMDHGEHKNALQVAFECLDQFGEFPELSKFVEFGDMDRARIVNGYDISQHGHKGQNGSAGSTNLFSKWNTPMVTGHTHSPALVKNVLTVGVSASLKQGYNRGGSSSWNNSHGLIFPNKTAQIVPIRGLY